MSVDFDPVLNLYLLRDWKFILLWSFEWVPQTNNNLLSICTYQYIVFDTFSTAKRFSEISFWHKIQTITTSKKNTFTACQFYKSCSTERSIKIEMIL
jgi:hypothetical protein